MNIYKPNSFTNTNATTSVVIRKKKKNALTKINNRLNELYVLRSDTLYKVRGFYKSVVFGMP